MYNEERLPKGWEILFACYLLNGEVLGKVRLQKVVSELQKEGFPVDYSFIILERGPFSSTVQDNVRHLEANGLIEVRQAPMPEGYSDRVDYILTEKGKRIVEDKILPLIEREYYYLAGNLLTIPMKYSNNVPSREIVKLVHEELNLDNKDEFRKELENTLGAYRKLFESLSGEDHGYCLTWVAVMGLADLAIEYLEKIETLEKIEENNEMSEDFIFDLDFPEEAGKYFILSKAKEGLDLITTLYPLEECRNEAMCVSEKWDECKKFEQKIKAIFMAIERNALVYFHSSELEGGEEFQEMHSA
ncbi:hypothetical protein [Archaeoglobus sp.]